MPRWIKGQSGNPRGRPTNPEVEAFREALIQVENEQKIPIFVHAIRKAYKDNDMLKEILKKLIADKIYQYNDTRVTAEIGVEGMKEFLADITSRLERSKSDGKIIEVQPSSEHNQIGAVQR